MKFGAVLLLVSLPWILSVDASPDYNAAVKDFFKSFSSSTPLRHQDWWAQPSFSNDTSFKKPKPFMFPGNIGEHEILIKEFNPGFDQTYPTRKFFLDTNKKHVLIITSLDPRFRDRSNKYNFEPRFRNHQEYKIELANYLSSVSHFLETNGLNDKVETTLAYINRHGNHEWIDKSHLKVPKNFSPGERLLKRKCGTGFANCIDNLVYAPVGDYYYASVTRWLSNLTDRSSSRSYSRIKSRLKPSKKSSDYVKPLLPIVFILGKDLRISSVLFQAAWTDEPREPIEKYQKQSLVSLSNTIRGLSQVVEISQDAFAKIDGTHNPTILPGSVRPSIEEITSKNIEESQKKFYKSVMSGINSI